MDIEQAKPIHSKIMKVLMHTQGIGEITTADVIAVKETSLSDMILANSLMDGYQEGSKKSGFKNFVSTTDIALAELYLRIHDEGFMSANEFQEICSAMDDAFEDTENGHGVLIDGSGYYSLIELTRSGDCAEKTLCTVHSAKDLYDYAKSRINEGELV